MIDHLLPHGAEAWVYLAHTPLLWLTLTLVAYVIADRISMACGRHPAVNLVVIAAAMIILALYLTGTSYETYFEGAQFIHFLLGPATVALAIPLYRHWEQVRASALPIVASLTVGALVGIFSAAFLARALKGSDLIVASLAPKSVTSPIAMGLSEQLGGAPFLTTALVIVTGVAGAMMLTPLMRLMRIKDSAAIGMAAGVASHGIGTARAFHIDSVAGAFGGIGMGLNGAFTSVILPILRPLLGL
ncbi:putative murein hydrolase (TIGR00659 family) [Rhodoblastus acidophilus]|uniref:LrgB family protein n=1 Tax=Rhodoblastus acidophilus TaxID=1074 RepID=UPI00222484C7|nr:LrgB family protein [Rhodoblastus acidophilus]MCW2282755.1 putative murein hydrolase (TIGR00659 family) [Rhodoblastus acidophilus]MCW2331616.1 putative murein hydrolase (TIGR00659 family) [Rhodoblastus acidophilus]